MRLFEIGKVTNVVKKVTCSQSMSQDYWILKACILELRENALLYSVSELNLPLSYDNAKVTINLQWMSNLAQNILQRMQVFLKCDSLAKS